MSERAPGAQRVAASVRVLVYAALVAAVLVAYEGVRRCAFTDMDDPQYVTINRQVLRGLTWEGVRWALTTGHAANWHPLTWVSHMLDVELYGLRPLGHHVTSVALHALNGVLALVAVERLTRSFWRAAAVAALFALHPQRVESVAWIAERKDVLCALFFFLTLIAYARYVERPGVGRYVAVAVAFALGLLAKPMLVTAPCVLLLLDVWPLDRLRTAGWRRLVREKLPLFALALASSAATFLAQRAGGAVQSVEHTSVAVRSLNAVISYGHYLQQMLWPAGLCPFYPYPRSSQLVPLALSAGALAGITWFALRERRRRAYVLVGWLWFLGMLVPAIGLVQVGGQAYADRYTYLPSLGIALALAWTVADALAALRAPRWSGGALTVAAAVPLALVAHRQVGFWSDPLTIFRRCIAVTRDNAYAQQCLGNALVNAGRPEEAIAHQLEATRLSPTFPDAHNGLGAAYFNLGRYDEASAALERAIELKPSYAAALYHLGLVRIRQGKLDAAKDALQRAVAHDPEHAPAHFELAKMHGSHGELDAALEHYRAASQLAPADAEVHRWIAVTLTLQGRVEDAIAEYEVVLRLQPNDADALNNIAWIRATHEQAEHRNGARAVECAERARDALTVPNALVFDTLAAAYAEAGRFDDAVAACERAIELADASSDARSAERFRGHLARFKNRQPLRGR